MKIKVTAEHILKSCPFCGHPHPILQNLVDAGDFFASCQKCGVQQIANHTSEDAVGRWNHRLSCDAHRCAEIASEVSNSYDKTDGFPSLHAVGAETVAVAIRREFGLEGYKPEFDLKAAATQMYEALKARMVLEDKHANCAACGGEGEPEECEQCFPFADIARLKMRAAIAKAEEIAKVEDAEPSYHCGAQHCDDPVCGTHGSNWAEWRSQQ